MLWQPNREATICKSYSIRCANYEGNHMSFDPDCPKLLFHKIINAVIAYANVSRLNAIRLIKSRNINSLDQVESSFKSLAYKG